jgi:hypothetical protein
MVALTLLLPTLAFMPIWLFAIPAALLVIRGIMDKGLSYFYIDLSKINKNFILILFIILVTGINRVFHYYGEITWANFLPYTVAMPIAYYIAKHIRKKDFKLLVFFILIEALVVFVQYFSGVNTFFSGIENINQTLEGKADLLYYRRPFGLSMNSSVVAYKLLLAYLIVDYLKLKNLFYLAVRVILLCAIFFTFNRTVFLVLLIYFAFSIIRTYGSVIEQLLQRRIFKYQIKYVLYAFLGVAAMLLIFFLYKDSIVNQVTRGRNDSVDLSGRDHIWAGFIEFIEANPLWGNGGEKYAVLHGESMAHGHNSFLQIAATHGLIIASLFVFMILRNLKGNNLIFILVILTYSMFQYGIFWGVSLMDIFLFKFLFFYRTESTYVSSSMQLEVSN